MDGSKRQRRETTAAGYPRTPPLEFHCSVKDNGYRCKIGTSSTLATIKGVADVDLRRHQSALCRPCLAQTLVETRYGNLREPFCHGACRSRDTPVPQHHSPGVVRSRRTRLRWWSGRKACTRRSV